MTGDTAQAVTSVQLIAADPDDSFRVLLAKVRSTTAKPRHELPAQRLEVLRLLRGRG
jgi:hypothetical protein